MKLSVVVNLAKQGYCSQLVCLYVCVCVGGGGGVYIYTVQITFIFIGQTRLGFANCVCTCVTNHSNAFRNFLNWLKNSKRVWHEPKLHISHLPLFANFDL